MRTTQILRILPLVALFLLPAQPVLGHDFNSNAFGRIDWGRTAVTFYPAKISFLVGHPARSALDAAVGAWNNQSPGTRFRFSLVYDDATTWSDGDGKPSIVFTSAPSYDFGDIWSTTALRWSWFLSSHFTDADILFNTAKPWDFTNVPSSPPLPYVPYGPYNLALAALHELGHALGLKHEFGTLSTMGAYPAGGTLGNSNFVQPLSDDVEGNRILYGICCTERDLFASAYKAISPGSSWIPAPGTAYRGYPVTFPFTVGNRGTTPESVRVEFYLSPDRFISTSDTLLGATTLYLSSGTTSTLQAGGAYIPPTIAPGNYYLGYVVDPANSISEVEELNNAVALVGSTNVPDYSPPMACLSADPMSGAEPLHVSFDGSCSSDPDGSIVSYQWDFGDGSSRTGASVLHVYPEGTYTVRLTVRDNSGWTSQTTTTIFVSGPCGAFPNPPCQ